MLIRYAIEVFDERAQAVPVCRDDDLPAGANLGRYFHLPIGHHPVDSVLETFRQWQLFRQQGGIARLIRRMTVVIGGQCRGRNIIAAAPNQNLFFAELGRGFGFVQALKGAIVALVQTPVFDHRYPPPVEFFLGNPECADCASQ